MVSLLCQTFRHSNQTLTNTALNIPFCDPQSPSASMQHSSRQLWVGNAGLSCWLCSLTLGVFWLPLAKEMVVLQGKLHVPMLSSEKAHVMIGKCGDPSSGRGSAG